MTQRWPRTVLGVDPGTANIGFALLRKDSAGAKPRALFTAYLGTTKGRGLVVADDTRRLGIILDYFESVLPVYVPDVVVIEQYTPRGGAKSGWKVVGAVWALWAVARARGYVVRLQAAKDRAAASPNKAEVVEAMRTRVDGFAQALAGWPATKHEHIADAAAHAVAVLET